MDEDRRYLGDITAQYRKELLNQLERQAEDFQELEARVRKIENWQSKITGALAVVVFIWSCFLAWIEGRR